MVLTNFIININTNETMNLTTLIIASN